MRAQASLPSTLTYPGPCTAQFCTSVDFSSFSRESSAADAPTDASAAASAPEQAARVTILTGVLVIPALIASVSSPVGFSFVFDAHIVAT